MKPQKVFLEDGTEIKGATANVRSSDNTPLGIVGDRYTIVQNSDAFAFTDALLGEGVKYETAGSLKNGKIIWLLAKMPEQYIILGDQVDSYVVFTNTHDGSGAVRVATTPIRVVCNNTLNLALKNAKRTWSARHTGSISGRLDDAADTLKFADAYMRETQNVFEDLYKVKMNEVSLLKTLDALVPITADMSQRQEENARIIRSDIWTRYKEAPDLKVLDKTGARFIQAVADTTSHMEPIRRTANYAENKFKSTIDGNALLDKALDIVLAA